MKLAKPHFDLLAGGATFPELTKGTFKKLEILTPPSEVMKPFDEFLRPILNLVEAGLAQNALLARSRDMLLPQLISGKLAVEELEIAYPPSMELQSSKTQTCCE